METHWSEKGTIGSLEGIEICGYPWVVGPPKYRYFYYNGYKDDGSNYYGILKVNGNTCTLSGNFFIGPKSYYTKGTDVFADDLMSITQTFEISTDGNTYVPWWEAKFTKVSSTLGNR
jgi:hypothetical protein